MRPSHIRQFSAATLLFFATACGGVQTIGGKGSSEKITRDQIVTGNYATAYDVVEKLHPNWLRAHNGNNAAMASQILVYLDGTKFGVISTLGNIRANNLDTIEHIDGQAATLRFGSGHSEGVIYVSSLGR